MTSNFKTDLSKALLQWLENQILQIYPSSKKKINLEIVTNDIFLQPFLGKFLLKINYQYFQKTQLIHFIDSMVLRKLSAYERKIKFMKLIQRYFYQLERKKFQRIIRQKLFSSQEKKTLEASSQIIRIILWMAIRCQNKNQFIERIFKMSCQIQHCLMDQIMEVQKNLVKITQKQQLMLQLNYMKQSNKKFKNSYEELVDYQNKILDQCQKQNQQKQNLLAAFNGNKEQKLSVFEQLKAHDIQKPYLKIYKQLQQKNSTLTRILIQKQSKQNELQDQHLKLKQKLDEFEQVLFQLGVEKRKIKVVLNDKKNESFHLEMRASLRLSQDKQNFRKSQIMKKKSLMFQQNALRDITNNNASCHLKMSLKAKNKNCPQINQSMNTLSKIEQLKLQKQSLLKQFFGLKAQNNSLKRKEQQKNDTFKELSEIYSQMLSILPQEKQNIQQSEVYNQSAEKIQVSPFNKQTKKNVAKSSSKRYFQSVQI